MPAVDWAIRQASPTRFSRHLYQNRFRGGWTKFALPSARVSLGGVILLFFAGLIGPLASASDQLLMGTNISIHASSSLPEEERSLWFAGSEVSADLDISGDPVVNGGSLQFVLEIDSAGESEFLYFSYEMPAKSLGDGTPLWSLSTDNTSDEGILRGFEYNDELLEQGTIKTFRIRKRSSEQFNIYGELSGQNADQLLDLHLSGELQAVYIVFTAHGGDPDSELDDPGGRTCLRYQRAESIVCEDDGGVAFYATRTCEGDAPENGEILREEGCPPLRDPCPESSSGECQAYYVSPDGEDCAECGDSSRPFKSIAYATAQLNDDDALLIRSGLYPEKERIVLSKDNLTILGDGLPLIDASYYELKDTSSESWSLWHDDALAPDTLIYHSTEQYTIEDSSIGFKYVAASFEFRGDHYKLISYPCYAALASTHHFYFSTDPDACTLDTSAEDSDKDVYSFECTIDGAAIDSTSSMAFDQQQSHCPYIGPGIYWDRDGLVNSLAAGRLYIRFNTHSPEFDWLEGNGDPYRQIPTDPNQLAIRAHLQGTYLYQQSGGGTNLHISGLKLVHGAVRIGGDSTGGRFHDIELDGTTSDNAIEIYSGASDVSLDAIAIDDLLPDWVTWFDVKKIYSDQLMTHGISFNGAAGGDEPLHDISITNSSLRNMHDGIEMVAAAYHDVDISGNDFEKIQDDVTQLTTSAYNIDIYENRMVGVGTSVSRQGNGDPNPYPGTRYIHHNIIDVSSEKLFCRLSDTGSYGSSLCNNGAAVSRDAFTNHGANDTNIMGDTRYIYNNTIILNGGEIAYGFKGAYLKVDGQFMYGYYPYGVPSLIFNNIFIQMNSAAALTKTSPNWHRLYEPYPASPASSQGPTLIADGNLFYRIDGDEDEQVFEVSGSACDLEDFRTNFCSDDSSNPEDDDPINMYFWDENNDAIPTLSRSWDVGGRALYGNPQLDEDYQASNCELLNSVDAVDLENISSNYFVTDTTGGTDNGWTLTLSNTSSGVLPGIGSGEAYRGAFDNCGDSSTPVPEPSFSILLVVGLLGLQGLVKRRG